MENLGNGANGCAVSLSLVQYDGSRRGRTMKREGPAVEMEDIRFDGRFKGKRVIDRECLPVGAKAWDVVDPVRGASSSLLFPH